MISSLKKQEKVNRLSHMSLRKRKINSFLKDVVALDLETRLESKRNIDLIQNTPEKRSSNRSYMSQQLSPIRIIPSARIDEADESSSSHYAFKVESEKNINIRKARRKIRD